VCNHPYMFKAMDPLENDERLVQASSKLVVLDKLLAKLHAEGRKCLVYSQFTSMLDILGDYLAMRGYKFLRLDGSTPAARRRYEISCFENPKSDRTVTAPLDPPPTSASRRVPPASRRRARRDRAAVQT
jgi:SWI/SNF-related matrix-associated actin-dependent regulator of chromatin subfamily A member 5